MVFLTQWTKLPVHDSNEISPVPNSLHFIVELGTTSSKISHVFNGTTREVPNEKLQLVHWTDLASMRSALRDHQLADLSKDLLRSNRFLSKNQSNTWKSILDPHDIPEDVFDQLSKDANSGDHYVTQLDFDPNQEDHLDIQDKEDPSTG